MHVQSFKTQVSSHHLQESLAGPTVAPRNTVSTVPLFQQLSVYVFLPHQTVNCPRTESELCLSSGNQFFSPTCILGRCHTVSYTRHSKHTTGVQIDAMECSNFAFLHALFSMLSSLPPPHCGCQEKGAKLGSHPEFLSSLTQFPCPRSANPLPPPFLKISAKKSQSHLFPYQLSKVDQEEFECL